MDGLGKEADEYHLAGGPAADTEHIVFRLPDPLEVEQDLSWAVAAVVGRRHPCRLLQPPQPARIRPHRCAANLSSSASRSSSSSSSAARSYEVVVRLWETVAQLSHAKYLQTAVLATVATVCSLSALRARMHAQTDNEGTVAQLSHLDAKSLLRVKFSLIHDLDTFPPNRVPLVLGEPFPSEREPERSRRARVVPAPCAPCLPRAVQVFRGL